MLCLAATPSGGRGPTEHRFCGARQSGGVPGTRNRLTCLVSLALPPSSPGAATTGAATGQGTVDEGFGASENGFVAEGVEVPFEPPWLGRASAGLQLTRQRLGCACSILPSTRQVQAIQKIQPRKRNIRFGSYSEIC